MKTINLKMPAWQPVVKNTEPYLVALIMLLLWFTAPKLMVLGDGEMGHIDPSIWLLVLLAIISFLLILGLCWWLLKRFWMVMGLPGLGSMVLQFNSLQLWQQLGFWLASFALLLLAAIGALVAIL
ncbi:hypothetical protein HDC92_002507 [Pedobacter sp. AK017]|uniref:hypothetical protein n=1 Tax=Pedobacter sp. AK017 TaxID=2723073 RepID=UPI001619367C|nr:hypothetical protein [Pedobacter sp. AK017]MBB5438826.1 hypothetical protein [Pedobacter sp. AK017]